ncbi:MAG: tRNA pseudouridine(55) synthase TruB [Actinomycetota bacterium]
MSPSEGPCEGLLLIDKPQGPTSHDVVDVVRRSLGTRKVGHAGTLDPMASGLLVVCVGRATRLLRYLSGLDKTYEGTARLGEETDTLDADGEIVARSDVAVTEERLRDIVSTFAGPIQQIPPAHSAVKVDGEPAYRAARRGEEVRTVPRTVRIDRFDVTGYDGVRDFDFAVDCSGGTYIRSLVADVGRTLACGAHLTRLRRTRVGPFTLAQACAPDDLAVPLPLETAVAHLPCLDLDEHEAEAAGFGRPLGPAGVEGPYGVYGPDGKLIGIYRDDVAKAKPEMILAPPA